MSSSPPCLDVASGISGRLLDCTFSPALVLYNRPPGHWIGCYYVKPNYPGRSSHCCNAGFIVSEIRRAYLFSAPRTHSPRMGSADSFRSPRLLDIRTCGPAFYASGTSSRLLLGYLLSSFAACNNQYYIPPVDRSQTSRSEARQDTWSFLPTLCSIVSVPPSSPFPSTADLACMLLQLVYTDLTHLSYLFLLILPPASGLGSSLLITRT